MLCFSELSNAQTSNTTLDPTKTYVTGDLVNSTATATATTGTWQNIGQWGGSLTCWAPGDPGYCGPNPYFGANGAGVINFSYGLTNVYQVANIAAALPNSGTGLRVNGFNFGFMAKNGNGWDDGQVDYLTAFVKFYDPSGNVVTDRNYNLNYKFDWTAFNYSEIFSTPFASKDLSTVQYGFTGRDNNFWAGPYGPEIYNISFSLKYSVDPCYINVLSSPSCPGWADAMAKITATSTAGTVQTDVAPTLSSESTTTAVSLSTVTAPIIDSTATTTATATTAAQVSLPASNTTPVASITNSVRQVAPLSTSSVLTSIRRSEENLQNTVNSTVQRSVANSIEAGATALQQAQQQAFQSQQASIRNSELQAQQSSEAAQRLINSTVENNAAAATVNNANSLGASVSSAAIGAPAIFSTTGSTGSSTNSTSLSTTNALVQDSTPINRNQIAATNNEILVNTNATATASTTLEFQAKDNIMVNRSQPTVNNEVLSNTESPVTALTRPGDPMQAAKMGAPVITTMVDSGVNTGPVVRNVPPPAQLAGGADFSAMSRATDINSYAQLRLQDAAFYQPREIYRGQRVIDNARVLRGLGTDRLHQQMVDQQYNKGN